MSDWRHKAKCRSHDGEMWFPVSESADTSDPRRICLACPVRWECGAEALEARETEGIWAGYWMRHQKERQALKRELPDVAVPEQECIGCGAEYVPGGADVGKCNPCVRGMVRAEPVREYLRKLHGQMTYREISALTGLSMLAVQSAKTSDREYMTRDLAAAILSVPAPPPAEYCVACSCEVYRHRERENKRPGQRVYGAHGLCATCYQRRNRSGQPSMLVDPGPTLRHVGGLLAAEMTLRSIARSADLPPRTVQVLWRRRGEGTRIHRRTAAALLSVKVPAGVSA